LYFWPQLFVASFAHVAVGLAMARLHAGATPIRSPAPLIAFSLLALSPDADVIIVALGCADSGASGHRGASHSLLTATIFGLAASLFALRLRWRALRTGITVALAVASHGVLDAFGEGGRGIPLLWPFSDERFFAPWRMLPDAPRGLQFLTMNGFAGAAREFLIFLPLTAFAFWPSRVKPSALAAAAPLADSIKAAKPQNDSAPASSGAAAVDENEPPLRSTG
jgi:inner membrane protein